MSDTLDRSEDDVPVHDSPVLYFARCGCTYYHTTPDQIPLDGPNLPDKLCQQMVPDTDNAGKLEAVQKFYIEGNCRVHDIEMIRDILRVEDQPGDNPEEYCPRDLNHLEMVRSKTARKYRALNHFNAKWTIYIGSWLDLTLPLDSSFEYKLGGKLTKEEKRRFPYSRGLHHFSDWRDQD